MSKSLSRNDLQRLEQRLREREQQLLSSLQSGRERSDDESFQQIAGEAPDPGDAALADVVKDVASADRLRLSSELRDVQDALERIASGAYGMCQRCGRPIDRRRLDAFPAARYDFEHQQVQERQRMPDFAVTSKL